MGLRALVYLYGRRLRVYPVQELLAGVGIATGVALAFAVMVANSSVVASAGEIVRGVTGAADLQLAARDVRGFDERMLDDVRRLPGVERAAPVLDQRAVLVAPNGNEVGVTLVSMDPALAAMSGALTRNFGQGGFRLTSGLLLPQATADELRLEDPVKHGEIQPLPQLGVHVRGRARHATVAAVLGKDTIGALTDARLAVLPLPYLQRMAGLPGRVTRIFVDVRPGAEELVREELTELADGRLTVADAEADTDLLEQATGPTNQVTFFFAAISALLGFLLAFNAMLLTAPERRRLVGALRIQGYRPAQIVLLMLFQALALGVVASAVGIAVGSVLARGLFHDSPEYLAPGFTLGTRTIIGNLPLVLALVGGVVASCLAAAPPLLDLRRGRAVDAVFQQQGAPGNGVSWRARGWMLGAAGVLVLGATMLLVWLPELALLASVMLAFATLLTIPAAFGLALRSIEALIELVPRLSMLTVALLAMRATTLRSLALAATGAVAVFGSVAIGGARDDLLRGIGEYTADYVGTADVWIGNPADNQATNDFDSGPVLRRVSEVRGVEDVRPYRGGFLDSRGRRTWVIARSPSDPEMLPESQLVDGQLDTATTRLRTSGWVALSGEIAEEHDAAVGDRVALPTPTGRRTYRVAATTTNLGWAPGAIILNGADYRHAWGSATASAIEVDLEPGEVPDAVARRIAATLGAPSSLRVQTAAARAEQIDESAGQGLRRLGQISGLLLVAAVLAMAAAMGAAIWQRRVALASLRVQSFSPRQLWLLVLLEAIVVLGTGGLIGALFGIYGQWGADRFLEIVTGFPVAPVPAGAQTLRTFGLVVVAAVAIVAVPGWLAVRVSPRLGLGRE